ncbi:hypothetical protein HN014_01325 [Aquimarina sp. TRL1]|uniref:HmuY family protein n=1 Tax=Aquimarina sp. (strain TRL1) TaxID=2736252 RepID=UPI001588AD72|nr:HmuY family protein [Aquimarina sp. TRL1]QKX03609.1 hypothetical protein HN014_01325 [Aquimarina sp. TRL1]
MKNHIIKTTTIFAMGLLLLSCSNDSDEVIEEEKQTPQQGTIIKEEITYNPNPVGEAPLYLNQLYIDLDDMKIGKTVTYGSKKWVNFDLYGGNDTPLIESSPITEKWHLVATAYEQLLPEGIPYTVYGVLSNINESVAVSKFSDMNMSEEEFKEVYQNFTIDKAKTLKYDERINTIGYDWKTFDMSNSFSINQRLFYLIKTVTQKYYKLRFLGFSESEGRFLHIEITKL